MKKKWNKSGSVLLIAVFAVALLSTLVAGMLQVNTEEIMLVHNHVSAVRAGQIASAGLNAAFAELREDSHWQAGFTNVSFSGGSYTVKVTGTFPSLILESAAVSANGFKAKISADVTVSTDSPHVIRVDNLY